MILPIIHFWGFLMLSHKTSTEFCKLQESIFELKKNFEQALSANLNLTKVQAPLFLPTHSGLNDDLNGVEPPVKFEINNKGKETYEVIQSLAKWKRFLLGSEGFELGTGLYTDMRAIRPCDELDATHSIYVDQWDWEKVISKEQRTVSFLKETVSKIYEAMKSANATTHSALNLPESITFIHSQELYNMYPDLESTKERESLFAKEKKAIFVIGVGAELSNGKPHDPRAPDYDDWTTQNEDGYLGLNGDIILYSPELDAGVEISSMGIRVDREALLRQLEHTDHLERKSRLFHSKLLADELPLTIGGGIGQSRLSMLLLRQNHIANVQAELFDSVQAVKNQNVSASFTNTILNPKHHSTDFPTIH